MSRNENTKNREVLIAGGSGLIGKALFVALKASGYTPIILSRNTDLTKRPDFIFWDPANKEIDLNQPRAFAAVINLCGEGIADKKWTEEHKKALIISRTQPTYYLADLLRQGLIKSDVYIGAAAVGIYGDRKDEVVDEQAVPAAGDFLSTCCKQWEEAHAVMPADIRRVVLRIGIVLSARGGVIAQYKPLWAMRMVPFFGPGRQYVSWISDADLAAMMIFALENELEGTYNAVSSQPVTSKAFAVTYLKALGKKGLIRRIPVFALKLLLGESRQMILDSQRVSNKKILDAGFRFRDNDLEQTLKPMLS